MVTDPTYENFNYSQLLNQAVSPITTLANGRLAVAQLKNQQAFENQRDVNLANLSAKRDTDRLQQEANIRESERLKLKNEAANQVFSNIQARHPDWKPDPSKSLEDNIASAQGLDDKDTLSGVNAIAQIPAKAKAEKDAILDGVGYNNPADPTIVNRMLVQDPSLTTGHIPVLGPKEIAELNRGKTPEQIAKNFSFSSNQQALLNAAQTARATVQQNQRQIAMEKAQVQLQGVDSKYAPYNQISSDLLSSISRNKPWLLGSAAGILGTSVPQPASSLVGPDGLSKRLTGAGDADSLAAKQALIQSTAASPKADLTEQSFGLNLAANKYATAAGEVAKAQSVVDALKARASAGEDVSDEYEKAKDTLNDWTTRQTEAVQQGLAIKHTQNGASDFFNKIGYFPGGAGAAGGGSLPPLPTSFPLLPPAKDAANQSTGANLNFSSPPMPSAPPSGQPATPVGTLTNLPQGQPSAAGGNSPQQGQIQALAARNKIQQILGTSDPNSLQKIKDYVTQQGINPQAIQTLVSGALNDDPTAIQQMKQIASKALGAGTDAGATIPPPVQQPSDMPPSSPNY